MTAERRATLWLLAMCAVWGSSCFSMQLGVKGLVGAVGPAAAPASLLFLRFLAAAVLFPLVLPRGLRELTARAAAAGLLLAVPFYAGFLLQVTGLVSTSSTVSAFLTNLTVVLTPVLGRLCFRERLTRANLAGAAIALAGVFVLTDPLGGRFGRGEVLTVLAAVAFTFQIQYTNTVTRRHPPESVTFVMFVAATVCSGAIVFGLGVGPGDLGRALAAPHVAWTVLYNATACSIVAITIMNRFQREIPPTRAAVLYTLEPVFAAAFAALLVGEEMTFRKLAGGAVIVAGNLVCELFRAGTKAPPVTETAGGGGGPGSPGAGAASRAPARPGPRA